MCAMSQNKYVISKTIRRQFIKSETDCISELQDEILYSIVSYFTVRDAAIASVVSSRWRHLCASMSNLEFDLGSMFLPDTEVSGRGRKGACQPHKDIFVRGVNQFLQFFKGSQLTLFRISFCLEKDSTYDINHWVSFAASMSVKDLYLVFLCEHCYSYGKKCQYENLYTLRSELLSQGNMAKVQNLFLSSCILGPGVLNQFSNLISLNVWSVILGAYEVETIISCCLNLETMTLDNCTLIPILCIPSSLHLLKFLAVTKCYEVEEIELSAKNLTRFDYDGPGLQIYSSRAPNLKQVFFRALDEKRMQYLFCQLAKDLPLIETLSVFSAANWVQCIPEQITTFRKVKQLELFSPTNVKFDILKIIAILKACPFLEKFHLGMYSVYPEQEMPGSRLPVVGVHKYLKEVHIGGFQCTGAYIDFVVHMLKYAVALERMVIDPKRELYYGVDSWLTYSRKTWDKGERAMVCLLLQHLPKRSAIFIK